MGVDSPGIVGAGGLLILSMLAKKVVGFSLLLLLLLLLVEDSVCESGPGKMYESALRDMPLELCRWLMESVVPITRRLANKKRRREVCMVVFFF